MAVGRPSKYTDKIADEIITRVTNGEPTRAICKSLQIDHSTLFAWLDSKPDFSQHYARAKEIAMEALADEILEIADDSSKDFITVPGDEDGEMILKVNQENIQRSRLKVDTRKWLMAKLAPKKYSDKQQVEHSGTVDHIVAVNVIKKDG